MKKLLITAMAAVSVGLCAKAADAIDASTFTENGTSFDDLTTGADFAGDNNFWQTPEGEGDLFKIIDVVYPEGATPQHWALATQEKALSIDTATPIFRNVNPVSDGNPPLDVSKKSVFFDSVVQFTATDVAPSMENNTTDKLAVWLYQSPEDVSGRLFEEESVITELVITAADSSDPTKTKHYPTGISVDPDSWHRLTIKSFNDEIGDLFFNVWVDKTQVKVGDTVNFKSLIDDTEDTTDGCYKLQGVAFDGKGAVDDIVFTTTEPEFAKNSDGSEVFNVAITAPNGVEIDSVMDGNGDSIEVSEGKCVVGVGTETIIVLVKCAGTVTNAGAEEQESGTWAVTVDVSSAKEGDSILVEITVAAGGSAKPTIGSNSYETGADLKAVVKSGTEITVPSGWAVDGKVLKDDKGATFATFEYYNLALADGIVTATLDQKAAAPFADATDDKEVLEVGEDASGNPELTVRIKPYVGLYYGAMTGTALDNLTLTFDYQEATTADVIEFTAKGKAGDTAGFIKVVVTDIDPKATEE